MGEGGSRHMGHKKGRGRHEAEKRGWGQSLEGLSVPYSGMETVPFRLCGAMRVLNFHGKTHSGHCHLLTGKRYGGFTRGCEDGEEGRRCSEDRMAAYDWQLRCWRSRRRRSHK